MYICVCISQLSKNELEQFELLVIQSTKCLENIYIYKIELVILFFNSITDSITRLLVILSKN